MRNKYFWSLQTIMMVAMLSVGFTSCGSDDDLEQTNITSNVDPEGTVVVNMNNGSSKNWISIGSIGSIHIDEANNFVGSDQTYEFASVGLISGLSMIKTIPTSGWSISAAVVPGTGYVLRSRSSYARLYVVDYIVGTTGGIIGATVKYQSPFEINKNDDDKKVDYTATTSVKRATIRYAVNDVFNPIGGVCFYEDYDMKYNLCVDNGAIYLVQWKREWGSWRHSSTDINAAGLEYLGECSSINSITKKASWGMNNNGTGYSTANFFPNGGYACCFITGSGDKKYMRFYAESYTLGSLGELETVTIQYQLY